MASTGKHKVFFHQIPPFSEFDGSTSRVMGEYHAVFHPIACALARTKPGFGNLSEMLSRFLPYRLLKGYREKGIVVGIRTACFAILKIGETKMNRMMRLALLLMAAIACGCSGPVLKVFPDHSEPFQEIVLEGRQRPKVLVISVDGMISEKPRPKLFGEMPGVVQEVVSQLRRAEKDDQIRAIVLKVNSFGGSATASDILYNEIMRFKAYRNVRVVTALMDVAASGGYYVSLPSDWIIAHPTTVTGSVGVLFVRPEIVGLMDKIGVGFRVNKSGKNKDMGAFYRGPSPDETEIFQSVVDKLADRFLSLVKRHRNLSDETVQTLKTARIFFADDALDIGLVDQVGYMSDAVDRAKALAGLPGDCRVVVYRRTRLAEETIYHSSAQISPDNGLSAISPEIWQSLPWLHPGFYYLWQP